MVRCEAFATQGPHANWLSHTNPTEAVSPLPLVTQFSSLLLQLIERILARWQYVLCYTGSTSNNCWLRTPFGRPIPKPHKFYRVPFDHIIQETT